jgi:hypothetical protein
MSIDVEENIAENDFSNDNDSCHSEELRSHISPDDEGDGNGIQVFLHLIQMQSLSGSLGSWNEI